MPQSAEHLDALRALHVRHGLLALTRADLADPTPARRQALTEIRKTPLGDIEAVPVSGRTGAGLVELRSALDRLVADLPDPDVNSPVRLWIDRVFSVRGYGTVVTGTLPAGTLRIGESLRVVPGDRAVTVRGLQALGEPVEQISGVARVAVNLRGLDRDELHRGDALVTAGRWLPTDEVDVEFEASRSLPRELTMHIGSAGVPARIRPLGKDFARIRLPRALPLRVGDRALLRDPGRRAVVAGVRVLDVAPPPLRGRGAAADRARELVDPPSAVAVLRRRHAVRAGQLEAMGLPADDVPVCEDWLVDPQLRVRLPALVAGYLDRHPLDAGMPVEAARRALELPTTSLVTALVEPPLSTVDGRICPARRRFPPAVQDGFEKLRADLAREPFGAPDADRLAELGLGNRELAALVHAGQLLQVRPGIYLLPGADERAAQILAAIAQPFTLGQARQALHTSRRIAVPLLELLDRQGRTVRQSDDRRVVSRSEA